MVGNPYYANAEAYAMELLQQKIVKDAQRSAQQTLMELASLKSFLSQGYFLYCIPFGGAGIPAVPEPYAYPTCPLQQETPMVLNSTMPTPPPLNALPCPVEATPPPLPQPYRRLNRQNDQSIVYVNFKDTQQKNSPLVPCADECNLGKDGIEVTIDLREYLPAEINVNVDEKTLEIKANHVDSQGTKVFARRYDLPACIFLDSVRTILTHDGFLWFSAAWCKME